MVERLDAFLSHRGFGSRSDVRSLIRAGRAQIRGAQTRDHGARVDGVVTVDGAVVPVGLSAATVMVHKPVGLACSHDEREAPLVFTLIPPLYAGLSLEAAGRLDRETSGLLILTTEGQLIHSLTNPKKHVEKRYRIAYSGTLSAQAVARVERGMMLEGDDRPTLPARVELHEPGADGWARATLHLREGRYHQVRRMIAELGGQVVTLHRDRIGALTLPDDLAPGQMRDLNAADIARLMTDAERIAGDGLGDASA